MVVAVVVVIIIMVVAGKVMATRVAGGAGRSRSR